MNKTIDRREVRDDTQWCITQAMLRCKLGEVIETTKCNQVCLESALRDIENFIKVSYDLYSNPLKHLRHFLPSFEWGYYEHKHIDAFVLNVQCSDYVWLKSESSSWEDGVITAKRDIRGKHHKVIYHPVNSPLAIRIIFPTVELSKAGCKVLARDQWFKA